MTDEAEDFKNIDYFGDFEQILNGKIDASTKVNLELCMNEYNIASRIDELKKAVNDKKTEEYAIDSEIKEYRKNLLKVDMDTKAIYSNIKSLEETIQNQRIIYDEYKQKVDHKKLESVQFAEKIKQQQRILDKKIVAIEKNLGTLFEAQEELALLYNAHKSKMHHSGRFLEYVKNFETKASLNALREKLDIDRPSKPVISKSNSTINQNQANGENHPGGEEMSFKLFKDILRGVLRENA
jgi:predicted RNase H-like nuclease (RuvC/YqgF family)